MHRGWPVSVLAVILACVAAPGAAAAPTAGASVLPYDGPAYYGLLRARDLTFFSLPHLDMRPAHALAVTPGDWVFETSIGYQNTWSLSPQVERFLSGLPGRRELGPAELDAIRALPGENYLIDTEIGLLDLTLQRELTAHWGVYAIASAVTFDGGIGDSTIEHFHEAFGFSSFGRRALARNRVRLVLDLRDVERVELGAPTRGGLLDPTLGLRYSGVRMPEHWNLVLEGAVKIPVSGRRDFLSTGEAEPGIQVTLQYFGARHAFYASASAVRYGRDELLPGTSRHIVPTAVFGVEYRWSERTHWLLQGYVSRPTRGRHETGLADLTETKHQASLGVYRSFGSILLSLAITENLQHLNNTPDVGLQLGLVWIPALGS